MDLIISDKQQHSNQMFFAPVCQNVVSVLVQYNFYCYFHFQTKTDQFNVLANYKGTFTRKHIKRDYQKEHTKKFHETV